MILRRTGTGAQLPALAVGIGLYLPPDVSVTLAIGAILGWVINRRLRGRAGAEQARRKGVLIASGFIVGESLVGVAMAAVIGGTGRADPLALVGLGFAGTAEWLGFLVFAVAIVWFGRRVVQPRA
jgi:uncharacterized oligopeptide transporter (OPT) family protein